MTNKKPDFSLVYITDLDNNNYMQHVEVMRENIKRIIRSSNLNQTILAKIVGVSRLTVKRFIGGNNNITFITANKFNNFVYKVHEQGEDNLK